MSIETKKRSAKTPVQVKSILLETVHYGLYRKLNSYELSLNDRAEPLRIDLFRHVRENQRFRARVYETVLLDAMSSGESTIRAMPVEYAVLRARLDFFPAQTEDEAFAYVICQIMKDEGLQNNKLYSADQISK